MLGKNSLLQGKWGTSSPEKFVCPVSGSVQGHVAWGSVHPGLWKAHGRRAGTRLSWSSLPTQTTLWFLRRGKKNSNNPFLLKHNNIFSITYSGNEYRRCKKNPAVQALKAYWFFYHRWNIIEHQQNRMYLEIFQFYFFSCRNMLIGVSFYRFWLQKHLWILVPISSREECFGCFWFVWFFWFFF